MDRYGHVVLHLLAEHVLIIFRRHDVQPCHCGELKCVGFIGGKTQTDIGAMDHLYLDGNVVFGLSFLPFHLIMSISKHLTTDEVEALGLKGSKKKKGRKLDEDYMVRIQTVESPYADLLNCLDRQPDLKPLQEKDVPKVVQAMRQTTSRKVLYKLLTRVKVNQIPYPHKTMLIGSIPSPTVNAFAWIQSNDQYP